jgi:tRNA nucleotidyltransferase (CCA-adding enzyme)
VNPPDPQARAAVPRDTDEARRRLASHAWEAGVLGALHRLRADGHQAWLVGGTVRDVLLGREHDAPGHPVDVATDLEPAQVSARFARVVPRGIAHGTVRVIEGDTVLEITTLRRGGAHADARHPDPVEFTADLRADLARRDLTVNALAFDPVSGVLVDAHGGVADLARGVLRAVGDPVERFREDGLRPLRVARLAAQLGLEPEPTTRAALGAARERSARVAMERVRDELGLLVTAPAPSAGFELLRGAGLLDLWLPELAACVAVPQNRHHAWDVYRHSLFTCDAAPADKPVVRWAALLHDIGKPATRVMRRGDASFHGHPKAGAELAERLLERLCVPAATRRAVVHLVREHMFDYRAAWTDAALRRWLRRVGEDAVADLFDLRIADALGNGLREGLPGNLELMRERIERLQAGAPLPVAHALAVDGDDVMRVLGIAPGPVVGAVLAELLEAVTEHPGANTREALLARLEARRVSPAREAPES